MARVTPEQIDDIVREVCDKLAKALAVPSFADRVSESIWTLYVDVAAQMNAMIEAGESRPC
ncbi:hypothetical protein [Nocardia wallacei]|uniref:hypothetical protein n=1 Tax=Nocardia wallacei TaxID=480035 RepID=UPI002454CB0F|nr:hypothetical protein [Nocardia wallacei]